MIGRLILALGLSLGVGAAAYGQSFNIDLDVFLGDQQGGNGAPSSAFGGAANKPGYWNRINADGPRSPVNLTGLDGARSTVLMLGTGGLGVSGGFDSYSNTGDYASLLNDYARVADEIDYHFSGLIPGRYEIYTYAVNSGGLRVNAQVLIQGADNPIQTSTGPMPGNRFIQGVTHTVHDLTLTGDSFTIQVSGPWPDTEVNGFQIVAVPEPASLLVLTLGFPALLARRMRIRMSRS